MYCSDIDENQEPRKTSRNTPSFSSSLLDEIYNSVDGNDALNAFDEMTLKKQRPRAKSRSMAEEDIASIPSERVVASRRRLSLMSESKKSSFQERDFLFFSSTNSSSSDSTLSSLDDHRKNKTVRPGPITKSKSTASKIYAGLKKAKRPISPGGRLRSFIISIFKSSKSKKAEGSDGLQVRDPPSSSSAVESKRTSRFDPASSTADREENGERPKAPLAPPDNELEETKMIGASCEENRRREDVAKRVFKSKSDVSVFRDEDAGYFSDSSSDLFELNHKTWLDNKRFCDELHVCETSAF